MNKKWLFHIMIFVWIFSISSCHMYEIYTQKEKIVTEIYFIETTYITTVGSLKNIVIQVLPSEVFDDYDTVFSVSDESVAKIYFSGEQTCIIEGLKEGSVIITAKIADGETKCAFNVQE